VSHRCAGHCACRTRLIQLVGVELPGSRPITRGSLRSCREPAGADAVSFFLKAL